VTRFQAILVNLRVRKNDYMKVPFIVFLVFLCILHLTSFAQDTTGQHKTWRIKACFATGNPEYMGDPTNGGHTAFGAEAGAEYTLYKKLSLDMLFSFHYAGFATYSGIDMDEDCIVVFNRKAIELNLKYNIPVFKKAKRKKHYLVPGLGIGFFIPGHFYSRSYFTDEYSNDYYPALGTQIYIGYELKLNNHLTLIFGARGRIVKFRSKTQMPESQSIYYQDYNKLDGNGADYFFGIVKKLSRKN
jgi:hypothetical protein